MQNGDSEVGVRRTYDQYSDKWTTKRKELRNRRFSRDLLLLRLVRVSVAHPNLTEPPMLNEKAGG